MKNLDLLAAKAAQEIITNTQAQEEKDDKGNSKRIEANAVDNLITKSLGVLQENGVYAALLYLYSRSGAVDQSIARTTREKLLYLTTELGLSKPVSMRPDVALAFLTEHVCNDLDRLLMVKQLWEQTLIYARYGAKARSVAEKEMP
jgi:hypothetical protein